jgi:uncharacterized membrane protein YjfL (UPF0719 family)
MSVRGSLDFELTNTDNKGICVAFAGYILAMSFIWNGATMEDNAGGPDYEDIGIDDQCKDYVVVLIFLLLGQVLLILTHYVNDYLILPKIDNVDNTLLDDTISGHESAVGIVECGSYICSGIIIGQSQYGWVSLDNKDGWGEAIGCMCFYWMLGQVVSVVFIRVSICITNAGRGTMAMIEIKEGNYAAALRVACDLIACGVCVGNPLGMSDSIVTFAVYSLCGLTLLALSHYLIRSTISLCTEISCRDTCLGGKVFDQDWGAALVEGVCVIVLSKLFTTFLRDCMCYAKFSLQVAPLVNATRL